ncbi:MAG: iron-sulfur cluster-binding domain-containing protein [Lachnospiraceae bacterium]|nr:iron-sulfur cluster-binding domain-containing protein [Lachnospiraceae bacterium]
MKVKGFLKDVGGASAVTKRRQAAYDRASAKPAHKDPMGAVAKALHPGLIPLTVESVRPASKTAKTIRFTSEAHLPYFRAGQFLTLVIERDGYRVTRPYSISSAPYETRGEHPCVEITVRRPKEGGFIANYLYDEVRAGDTFLGEVGLGEFHYEALRDARHVVAAAGGSGITPFVSMAKEIKNGREDFDLTILYGSVSEDDIVLREELEAAACDRVHVVHVLSGDNPGWTGEKGFLNRDIIKKYSAEDTTYFVCGPQVMYDFVQKELEALSVPKRRVRFEVFGQVRDITAFAGYPQEKKDDTYRLRVRIGVSETEIPARASEPIAVALERAGLKIHTACRSGSCGFCRIKVLSGKYFVCPQNDGRRGADRDFHYVHACSTYPLGDMTVKVNI